MKWVFAAVLPIVFVVGLTIYVAKRSIVIDYKKSILDWLDAVFPAYLMLLFVFLIDWITARWIKSLQFDYFFLILLIGILENGILVLAGCFFISKYLKWRLGKENLSCETGYTSGTLKLLISFCIFSIAIGMLIIAFKLFKEGQNVDLEINRICVWILCVIGTYIGIGGSTEFVCISDINSSIAKAKEELVFRQHLINIGITIVACLALGFTPVFLIIEPNAIYVSLEAVSILILSLFIAIIFKAKYIFPTKERSKEVFIANCNRAIKKNRRIKGRFGHISYFIEPGKLEVLPVKVIYKAKEKDKRKEKLFEGEIIPYTKDGTALNKINSIYEKQEKYIETEREKSKQQFTKKQC